MGGADGQEMEEEPAIESRTIGGRTKEEVFAKRGLRRAKLFEIQKLTRRARFLQSKK